MTPAQIVELYITGIVIALVTALIVSTLTGIRMIYNWLRERRSR